MADGTAGYADGFGGRNSATDAFPAVPAALKRISWGAVFAGLIVSVMVSLVLGLLGMGIGLSTVDPAQEANPFSGLGIGAAIWWLVSSLIALYFGGWVAGRVAGIPKRFDGAVHGILTWGLVTLATFYFLGTAVGKLVGGVSSMVGQGLSVAGQGISKMAPAAADRLKDEMAQQGVSLQSVRKEADDMVRQSASNTANAAENPQAASAEMRQAVDKLLTQGQQADREAVVNLMVSRTGKSQAEATQIVERWSMTAQQAKDRIAQAKMEAEQKAREVGQTAAAGMSKASLWAFVALLLGGFSAALGGRNGVPKDVALPRSGSRVAL